MSWCTELSALVNQGRSASYAKSQHSILRLACFWCDCADTAGLNFEEAEFEDLIREAEARDSRKQELALELSNQGLTWSVAHGE